MVGQPTIEVGESDVTQYVPGLGEIRMRTRDDSPRPRQLLVEKAGGTNRQVVTRFIADFMIMAPDVDAASLDALSEPVRAELRVATADYYGLAERYWKLLREDVRGDEALYRLIKDWSMDQLAEIETRRHAVRPGFRQTVKGILGALGGASDTLASHRARWFVKQLDLGPGLTLAMALNAGREQPMITAIDVAISDPAVLLSLRREVSEARDLTTYPRRQLLDGMRHLEEGEHVEACLQMLGGLEGAFRNAAFDEGTLDETGRLFGQRRPSVEGVVATLDLDDDYATFVKSYVFGGDGNDLRHCAARHGAQRQALICVAALAGWYGQSGRPEPLSALTAAMRRSMTSQRVMLSGA